MAARAVLALSLLVGFYVLALGIAALLLWLPYAEVSYLHHVSVRLDLFCVFGAAIVLWSILPRFDRFDAPGPRLEPSDHPRLFAVLREIARETGQAMPAAVYATREMNAWVAQRGGLLGVGGRPVMGLGLPLMQVLTTAEFRAILAHEFGHYHGGDTALGPIIYRTRAAIERTMVGMSRHSTFITRPFLWYLKLYVGTTHSISRRQELVADALAARVAGPRSLAAGLCTLHGTAPAFDGYWFSEVVPAIARGYLPPFTDGFRRFLSAPAVGPAVGDRVCREIEADTADRYDTHPSLRERLIALTGTAEPVAPAGEDRALQLLDDPAALESELLQPVVARHPHAPALRRITWDEMLPMVWLSNWTEVVAEDGARLDGLRVRDVAGFAGDPAALAVRMRLAASTEHAGDEHRARAAGLLGSALSVLLFRAGHPAETGPGEPISFRVGDRTVRPFGILTDLDDGTLPRAAWEAALRDEGLADVELSSARSFAAPGATSASTSPG